MNFEQWMKQIDSIFEQITGMSSSDFEDYHWWDCWNDGLSPSEASEHFFSDNGYHERYPMLFKGE